ncbi:uncharacterized protein LOC124795031 isoform X1 [Schistocerca piceifrons]|uniref:uncharacterized protein LOC124795031 isoform X1 n=1 Tax=Schistocerca piceifrons TaxID=274613 RepID=UPI001F5F55BC|nr:uncharacterized protein LOC124795031 isoform X1 [Schistocerca piceifrons]
MNVANRFLNTMAMDEELEANHAEEETSEENALEVSSVSFCNESFESPSIMQTCLAEDCERYGQDCDSVNSVGHRRHQTSSILRSGAEENEAEAMEVLESNHCSSSEESGDSDSDEENDSALSPVALIGTPLSTGKKNSHSKRSANKCIRTYNPQHDFFADCPELNEADGFLQWDDIEPKNCESHCTPASTVRSANKTDSGDSFVTPKRIPVSAKRSNSRTAKKLCKRNLKVNETGEASAGKITNTESLCMLMRGRRVVRDLLRRTENMRHKKCLRQNYGSPVSGGNVIVSPGVPGIHPLPQTPAKTRLPEDRNVLAAQPTTPILDAYDKDSNCIDELDPTQPASMLILQDVIAYVEVRSGGDNRSMGVKDQLQRLGAVVSDTFSDEVTHVVFKDGLPSTYNRALRRRIPVVSVLWIEACKKAGLRVSERMYPVIDKTSQAVVKPQKKFRKMKSIQPDYDGKVERKKKKVRKDVCLGAEEDAADRCNQTAVTPKTKSTKLNSIPESPNMTSCFKLFKQCVLTEVSTDSDCSPDNLRVPKKKVVKKKNIPPVPKWARKSFSGNSVAETLVGVAKIRRKDFEEIVSESPPSVIVQQGPHDSPLALRLLQKISSPALDATILEGGCSDSASSISNETPKRRTDRGVTRKIIGKEERQGKFSDCACSNVCECSDRLERNIISSKHSIKLSETMSRKESTSDAQGLRRKNEGSLKRKRNTKVCVRNPVKNQDTSRNLCHSLEDAEKQNAGSNVTNNAGDMEKNPCVSIPGSQKCSNIRKSEEGESSTLNSQAPRKQQSTLDQFFISKEAHPANKKLPVSGAPNSSLTDSPRSLTQMQESIVETAEGVSSKNLTSEVEFSNSKDRNVADTENQMSLPVAPVTEFETDEDEFSSSESDLMIPDVEKCIATVTQDLERADSALEQHEPGELKLKESSKPDKEAVPKRPLKRKLVPTLDAESSEPIVLSGITELQFQLMHQRKRRRCSLSDIYGFHLNKLSPKSSSEPDMRNIGSSSRDERRVSDDVSLLWKQRKAARKLRTPSLPSLVCTSLHKEDVDLVTAVVKSLGGFNIDNKVGPLTTHVVSGGPRRTLNMLFAIARGLWVLRPDWVLHSLEAGYWLDEEKFEMTDFSPVVMKNRIERQSFGPTFQQDLFSTVGPIFVVSDSSPPKEDLEELVQLCGGKIVTAARSAAIVVGGQTRNNMAICVSAKWILDSITSGSLQAFVDYDIIQNPA